MKEYRLPKTGSIAWLRLLDAIDLPSVMEAQEAARRALPSDAQAPADIRDTAYFQNLATRQTGALVGVRADGKLIAYMALIGPMELREAIALHRLTHNDVAFPHAALTDSVVIFSDIVIDPDWQDQGLCAAMISFALDLPLARVADHIFAQMPVANASPCEAFVTHGFGIVGAYDAKDGQPRFIFQKPAFGFDLSPAVIADDVDPAQDFHAIINLTQRDALVGLYDKDAKGKLAFFRNRDVLNIMPTVAKVQSQH